MQEELKRCNYLGDLHSIFELGKISIVPDATTFRSIASISALNTSINVKLKPCLLFFIEIGLLFEKDGFYSGTDIGLSAVKEGFHSFIHVISSRTLEYLIDNNLISPDAIIFNPNASVCRIKRSGVSFVAAVMRNLLLDSRALVESDFGIYDVGSDFEPLFEEQVKKRRAKMTLEQLMEQHKRQEEQGRKAEEFVLGYEKRRLLWSDNSNLVKQISDFDVSAGYDIVSFDSPDSTRYDRFIEVKSYSSTQVFFWSSNEMRIAQEMKERYYLYLVDMEQYQSNGYEPTIVCDPISQIMESKDWIIDTASVKVTKV